MKNLKKGFTLLELAIVIAIIAIPAVDFLVLSTKSTKIQDTRNKASFVTEAISSYSKSTENSAKEISGKYYYGALLAEELGISSKYMLDEWNNKFSYYVTKKATKEKDKINKHSDDSLYAKDNNIGSRISSGHIFALILHGEDRKGESAIELSNIQGSNTGTKLNPLILSDGAGGKISSSSKYGYETR